MVGRAERFTLDAKKQPLEEENTNLRGAVSALRSAVRAERGRREGAEKECHLLLSEFSRLENRMQVSSSSRRAGTRTTVMPTCRL